MIKFEFKNPDNYDVSGIIKATVLGEFNFPLRFRVYNNISNSLIYENYLNSIGYWCSYSEPCNTTIRIYDNNDNIVSEWKWNIEEHGDFIHRYFYNWCKNNKNTKGIAIGTHDGTTGEWTIPILENLTTGFLVEASNHQFNMLVDNYKNFNNVHTIKNLITPDGGMVEFFEGDDSYTNSVIKEHTSKFNNNNIKSNLVESISINDLIINCGLKDDISWLHLDVEGLDGDLIKALDDRIIRMPDVIIYESLNMSSDEKQNLINYLESKFYFCKDFGWNSCAIKNL